MGQFIRFRPGNMRRFNAILADSGIMHVLRRIPAVPATATSFHPRAGQMMLASGWIDGCVIERPDERRGLDNTGAMGFYFL